MTGRRPHPDEEAFDVPPPTPPPVQIDEDESLPELRAQVRTRVAELRRLLVAIDPDYGHTRGLFQFMDGPWPHPGSSEKRSDLAALAIGDAPVDRLMAEAERAGRMTALHIGIAERSPIAAEAIRRSRSHWVKEGSDPVRIAHATDPMIGCAWCIGSDRGDEAIAALRSISGDERYQLPHLALYVLAVDDMRRDRS